MSATREYRPALDGLRALAIAGVMAEHLHLTHVPAGGLGVDVFFVLSGYLITGLLVAERSKTGSLNLRAFYLRRVARLYPALLAVLVIGGVLVVADLGGSAGPVTRGGLIAGAYLTDLATYTHSTVWAIWGFTWSLAIEEHFYLIWPAIIFVVSRSGKSLRGVAIACGIVALIIGEITAKSGGAGPAPAYFQPQTHAFGLLLGCALALTAVPSWTKRLPLPALAGIVALMCFGPSATHASYLRVSVPVVAVLTAAVLAGLEHQPPVGKVLGWAPIRRVGVISYGLYLYHQVLFSEVNTHVHGGRLVHIVVGVLVALAVAEISYRFYESPIRSYGRRLGKRVDSAEPAAVSR